MQACLLTTFVIVVLSTVSFVISESILQDVVRTTGADPWVVYLGDDLTDEDAFHAIEDGASVVVGRRASMARFRLDSPADVASLLADLAEEAAAEVAR